MKEKRKGPIGRAAGLAEGVAATVRRLQREREPRVLVYDETGYARLVQPDGRGYERLLETAEKMVAVVGQAEAEAKPRLGRRGENTAETAPDRGQANPRRAEAKPRRSGAKPNPRRAARRSAPEDGS